MTSALRVRQLASSLGKNALTGTAVPARRGARRASTLVVASLPRPARAPAAAAGVLLSGGAGAAHADDTAVVDTAVSSIVDVVKATGDAVKAGLGVAEQGLDAAKTAYETISPAVKATADVVAPAVGSAVKAAAPVVQAGVRAAGDAASSIKPSLERVLSDTGVDAKAVTGAGEQAAAAAKPLLESLVHFVTTSPPTVLAETAVGLVAAWYLLPPVLKAAGGVLRGYAGDVSPAAALDALSTQGAAVLVDIRSAKDKESSGVVDLPSASKLVELEYAAIEDRKIRGQLRDLSSLEVKITAMQIAALKRLNRGAPVFILDRSGGGVSKGVAKELASRGFGKVYVVRGGFSGWVRDRLGTKLAGSVSRVEVLLPGSTRGGVGSASRALPAGGSTKSVEVLPRGPPAARCPAPPPPAGARKKTSPSTPRRGSSPRPSIRPSLASEMGSHLNDMADILKGEGAAPGRAQQGHASGLNQLSDAAEKIAVRPDAQRLRHAPGGGVGAGPGALPSQGLSQEQLIEATQPLQFQQPSQPDIPPPVIPESQNPSQPGDMDADAARALPPGAVLPPGAAALGAAVDPTMLNMMSNLVNAGMNLENFGAIYPYSLAGLPTGTEEDLNPSGGGGGRKGKKQTRRGPMDEMRQLVRILVKVFPHSVSLIGVNEEAGGGNRISEEQIKNYMERTLGDAPRPQWGVPTGWNGYLAELFSWATGKVVTGEECKRVAKREPGRSWEAMESELHALGVHPNCWPLPLTLSGVRKAEEKPVPIDIPAMPTAKRTAAAAAAEDGGPATGGGGGGGGTTGGGGGGGRQRSRIERDLQKMDELDLWKLAGDAIAAAVGKAGSSRDQAGVAAARATAKARLDEAFNSAAAVSAAAAAAAAGAAGSLPPGAAGSMLQYIPVMNLDNAGLFNLISGTGANFDPNDPAQAAALAALAASAAGPDAGGAAGAPPAKRQRQDDSGVGSPDEAAKTAAAAAAAAGAQLGTLPMPPPPLNVANFSGIPGSAALAAYMQIPTLNLGTLPGGLPGMPGAPAPGGEGGEVHPKTE